jgi:hypothetical protein
MATNGDEDEQFVLHYPDEGEFDGSNDPEVVMDPNVFDSPGKTGSAMNSTMSSTMMASSGRSSPIVSRGLYVNSSLQETKFVNSEKYWKEFEQSELFQNMKMISDEGIDLDESRTTNHPIERPAPVAVRSPPRKKNAEERKSVLGSGTTDSSFNAAAFGGISKIPPEDSIFEFVGDEVASHGPEVETHENYNEIKILPDCKFTDLAFHFRAPDGQARTSVKFASDVEPRIYWVREDHGTLGFLNVCDQVRRVLLRGLKHPTSIQVVDNRVYWLEQGNEWQYDGRISFLDTKTKKVHTLLSGLSEPRGLHVTPNHNVFFMETFRDFVPKSSPREASVSLGGLWKDDNELAGQPSILETDRRSSFSLAESLLSSRKSKESSTWGGPPTKNTDEHWSQVWKVQLLHRSYVNVSVPGTNTHLSGFQRCICKLPSRRDLWEKVNKFAGEVDRLDLFCKGEGFAEPNDITLVYEQDYDSPKLVIGLDLYEIRYMKLNEKQREKLQKMRLEKNGKAFDIKPVSERVQVGGAILCAKVRNLETEKKSRVEDDSQYFSYPRVMCTLPSAVHKIFTAPDHNMTKQFESNERISNELPLPMKVFLCCRHDAPSIFPIPSVEDALETPGFGLASLDIPDSFEICVENLSHYLTPFSSRGVNCSEILSNSLLATLSKQAPGALPVIFSPSACNGMYAMIGRTQTSRKVLPLGWHHAKPIQTYTKFAPDELKRRKEDEQMNNELRELENVNMDSDESDDEFGRARANSLAFSVASTGTFSAIGNAGKGGEQAMNVKVVLRERPIWDAELESGAKDVVVCSRRDCAVMPIRDEQRKQTFKFERVYNRNATQMDVFEETARPSVLAALDGYNVTIFAYGQTGTGKTYTMEGEMARSDLSGIIPRSIYTIFEILMSTVQEGDWDISVSHLEIYQEQLTDLLAPDELRNTLSARLDNDNITTSQALVDAAAKRGIVMKFDSRGDKRKKLIDESSRLGIPADEMATFQARAKKLALEQSRRLWIRKDPEKGMEVMNLTEISVKSPEEIFEILEHSILKRATAETLCNKFSSRSHAIFSVNVNIRERDFNGELTGSQRTGRLNLVDLSGSENIGRSGSTGERFKEARNINQGLLALGRVIKARTEGAEHVPYRDSKLTQLLQESLGGNCVTTLILTISPNHREMAETLSTLNYAHKAKVIENKPTKHVKVLETKKNRQGGGGRQGQKADDEQLVPLVPGQSEFIASRVPWGGRVPIRAPGSTRSRRLTIKNRVERTYDAVSADWVESSVLVKPNSSSFYRNPLESTHANFGYAPFKPPPDTPTLSSREDLASTMKNKFALAPQASGTLRKIFEKFPGKDLDALAANLRKVRGRGPKLGLPFYDKRPVRPSTGRSRHSNDGNGNINIDFEHFQMLFAACAQVDPINAIKTMHELGYEKNFMTKEKNILPPIAGATDPKDPAKKPQSNEKARAKQTPKRKKFRMKSQGGKNQKKILETPASALWKWLIKGPSLVRERVKGLNALNEKSGSKAQLAVRPSTAI